MGNKNIIRQRSRYECVCVLWNNTKVDVISSITQRKNIYFCPTLFLSFKTSLNQLTVHILDLMWCPESISGFLHSSQFSPQASRGFNMSVLRFYLLLLDWTKAVCPLTSSTCRKYVHRYSFIHSVFCLATDSKPPPNRFLHIVSSRASSFKWEYPLLSSRSSSSFLRLLPRLLVTFISRFIFLSITCFRRQLSCC